MVLFCLLICIELYIYVDMFQKRIKLTVPDQRHPCTTVSVFRNVRRCMRRTKNCRRTPQI